MTVTRLLAETDSAELAEWMAYDNLEPIDHGFRSEAGAAIVAARLSNLYRDGNQDAATPEDFMPVWGKKWRDAADDAPEIAVARLEGAINAFEAQLRNKPCPPSAA